MGIENRRREGELDIKMRLIDAWCDGPLSQSNAVCVKKLRHAFGAVLLMCRQNEPLRVQESRSSFPVSNPLGIMVMKCCLYHCSARVRCGSI
jgi:hypothetical protein